MDRIIFLLSRYLLSFFFFQAEDGIRDTSVTGVQTCALPISERWTDGRMDRGTEEGMDRWMDGWMDRRRDRRTNEIGRASCRERV